ncbi:MAG: glycosyltransferase family 2 protein [Lachnospiraceae bacterium]|nr:glycosyltransferase family 2 protein [Lachnospiraceae bacterium]
MISVIIPVYNCARYISETLDSVIAQRSINDNWKLEIIVVDDGSTDETLDSIRDYVNRKNLSASFTVSEEEKHIVNYVNREPITIKLIQNRLKKGAAGARNTGIKEASGRYIAFIDADDKWRPGKLSKQIELMKDTGIPFSFTGYEFADENCVGTGKIAKVPEKIYYRQALKNTTIFTSTVMLDMLKLEKEDIYFPYIESEDTANWWKILKKTISATGLKEPLTLYRRSKNTLSSNKLVGIKRIWNLYMNEGLSVPYSMVCFVFFAFNAVKRRL